MHDKNAIESEKENGGKGKAKPEMHVCLKFGEEPGKKNNPAKDKSGIIKDSPVFFIGNCKNSQVQ
jgi:hypothetical protein